MNNVFRVLLLFNKKEPNIFAYRMPQTSLRGARPKPVFEQMSFYYYTAYNARKPVYLKYTTYIEDISIFLRDT